MSTYATTEQALLTLLVSYGYSAQHAARGDFSILNNAGVTQAVVLLQARPSVFAFDLGEGRGSHGKRQQRHWIALIVYQARGQNNDGVTYTALAGQTDGIIVHLDKYPLLNSAANVKRAEVVEASEPRIRRDKPWIYQMLLLEVTTETAIAAVESIR